VRNARHNLGQFSLGTLEIIEAFLVSDSVGPENICQRSSPHIRQTMFKYINCIRSISETCLTSCSHLTLIGGERGKYVERGTYWRFDKKKLSSPNRRLSLQPWVSRCGPLFSPPSRLGARVWLHVRDVITILIIMQTIHTSFAYILSGFFFQSSWKKAKCEKYAWNVLLEVWNFKRKTKSR